ncbi:MAG: DEAD/DEAH box helicase family protein, partial [Lachnospiraceae bacterium]|nr:DEAD/DEAH box helicase family protein [Lachnospiraceae bacterium]
MQSGNHTPPPYLISGYLESRQLNKVTYPAIDTYGTAASCDSSEHCSPATCPCSFPKKNHFLLVTPLTRAGTGKTYASAFALRSQHPRKALFLVHREQIAKQAIKSYRNVFG